MYQSGLHTEIQSKNGSHVCVPTYVSHSVVSDSLKTHRLYLARLLCPWHSPGKNTGVGSHSLLQGIFSSQGLNQSLLHCRQVFYCLSHQGSPKNESSTNQRTKHRRDVPVKALTGRQPGLKSVLYQQAHTRP